MRHSRKLLVCVLLLVTAGCLVYLFEYRYFARMLPIPLSAVSLIYDSGRDAVAPRIRPRGRLPIAVPDLGKDKGVRKALNALRSLSPPVGASGNVKYLDINFERWMAQLRSRPMNCTDATLLFMLLAYEQGLPAREWWIWLSDEYKGGNAHSLVEFWNPRRQHWQVVDVQTSTIIRDASGAPVSMAAVMGWMVEGRQNNSLIFEQSAAMAALRTRGYESSGTLAALDTRFLLTRNTTPILNLKPPTWFATTPKSDLLIAVPVLIGTGRHNKHVYTTKGAMLTAPLCLLAAVILIVRRPRRPKLASRK